jgi:sialidase-1
MAANVEKIRLLPPSAENPRNSEGSFVKLANGRLLFAYSHFVGGGRDDAAAYLASRYSPDLGRTWSEDQLFIENEGLNTMSVTFLRLQSGDIALFYLVREVDEAGQQSLRVVMRRSTDEATTWSEPTDCAGPRSYYVVNNDRVIQLRDGRLVIPAADHGTFDGRRFGVGRAVCFLSDDGGATWAHSQRVAMPENLADEHLQEPLVVELRDGRLLMLCRTVLGCHYRSWSEDRGETWSAAEPTELIAPCSPASVRRLPTTGDLLIIYNDHRGILETMGGKRTPLVTALSQDEGRTWGYHKVLEDDPDGWYCYTAIYVEEEQLVLGYCAGNSQIGGLNLTQITRLPVSWLYE